jgi:hypothetical protein
MRSSVLPSVRWTYVAKAPRVSGVTSAVRASSSAVSTADTTSGSGSAAKEARTLR